MQRGFPIITSDNVASTKEGCLLLRGVYVMKVICHEISGTERWMDMSGLPCACHFSLCVLLSLWGRVIKSSFFITPCGSVGFSEVLRGSYITGL